MCVKRFRQWGLYSLEESLAKAWIGCDCLTDLNKKATHSEA